MSEILKDALALPIYFFTKMAPTLLRTGTGIIGDLISTYKNAITLILITIGVIEVLIKTIFKGD